jgi:mannose-1-phosphate guanylyltransferase
MTVGMHSPPSIIPVLLCGGSGSRLYPISTPDNPKHLRPFFADGKSLLQATLNRAFLASTNPICVGSTHQREVLERQIESCSARLIVEKSPKNTAIASLSAAIIAEQENPDAVLCLMPCDHVIADSETWKNQIYEALPFAATGHIVLFGIPPKPHTEYGYIVRSPFMIGKGPFYPVERFVEKPKHSALAAVLGTGRSFWNSGIFVLSAKTLVEAMRRHRPRTLERVRTAVQAENERRWVINADPLVSLANEPIDQAVMEQAGNLVVAQARFDWMDVGSLEQLASLCERNTQIHQEIRQYFATQPANEIA